MAVEARMQASWPLWIIRIIRVEISHPRPSQIVKTRWMSLAWAKSLQLKRIKSLPILVQNTILTSVIKTIMTTRNSLKMSKKTWHAIWSKKLQLDKIWMLATPLQTISDEPNLSAKLYNSRNTWWNVKANWLWHGALGLILSYQFSTKSLDQSMISTTWVSSWMF